MNKLGYKHTALGWIPEEWEVKKIKDIGKITSGTTPLRSTAKYHTAGTIPWVKTTDLNNSLILKTEEMVTDLALEETSLRIYPKGTVLVAMYGGFNQIGRTGLLGIEAAINQALSAITVDAKKTDQKFLLNWLNGNVGLWKTFAGSSRKDPNITSNDVSNFPFIVVPLTEQRKIAAILSTWDDAIAVESTLIAALQSRHQALAQRLLSGKVRLSVFTEDWKEVRLGDVLKERNETNNSEMPLLSIGEKGVTYQSESSKKDTSNEDKSKYRRIRPGDIGYNTMRMWQGRSALSNLEGIVSPAYTIVTPQAGQFAPFYAVKSDEVDPSVLI